MNISTDDLRFLRELQDELNTQEHFCQADPRFWVVTTLEWRLCTEDDEICRVDFYDESELVSSKTLQEALDCAYRAALDMGGEDYASSWLDDHGYLDLGDEGHVSTFGCRQVEIERAIEEYASAFGFSVIYTCAHRVIAENTMFLTYRECCEHIERNGYHYEDPKPYAMTAWRSPQVERLVSILQNADFTDGGDAR